jgi:hypothetical protein
MWIWIILIILASWAVYSSREDPVLTEVKKRYDKLRDNPPEGMDKLKEPIVITGFRERYGEIGYNVNKGYEIGLCLDGTANDVFHVLIHELAHSVTKSYAHNEEFWKNFDKIKKHCVKMKIYEPIKTKKDFCGKFIRD